MRSYQSRMTHCTVCCAAVVAAIDTILHNSPTVLTPCCQQFCTRLLHAHLVFWPRNIGLYCATFLYTVVTKPRLRPCSLLSVFRPRLMHNVSLRSQSMYLRHNCCPPRFISRKYSSAELKNCSGMVRLHIHLLLIGCLRRVEKLSR